MISPVSNFCLVLCSTRTCPRYFVKKKRKIPAASCKMAKSRLTNATGAFCKSFAPTVPPKVTPIAVGTSTEKSLYPRKAYTKKDRIEIGKITKMAVACALFSSKPVFCNKGTASIPPPPPNKLFAAPTATPQAS